MAELAINGGVPVRTRVFPAYRVMAEDEAQAAAGVVRSGVLSRFLGCWDADFFGGEQVQRLEREWAAHFGVTHAVAVNSNSSGLLCALGASGIGPGDEVIVSPYSMSVSASAPLFYGALPVFADIEPDTFCLDPRSVAACVTSRTRAIVVVDLFGQPYDKAAIDQIAERHGLIVIEDAAQAPEATWHGRFAGTLGRVGVFSLNYHKHIHCGEGGIIVTDDDDLAMRCRLIRNHAEAVVDDMGYTGSPINMIGLNVRMTEVEAAIARVQLTKVTALVSQRRSIVAHLEAGLAEIDFLEMPRVREACTHSYYMHAIRFDAERAGVSRNRYVAAVAAELPATELREAEGPLISSGYVRPLYLQRLYQERTGLGQKRYPFGDAANLTIPDYSPGICPVTEQLHFKELFTHEFMRPGMAPDDIGSVIQAFQKVAEHRDELR